MGNAGTGYALWRHLGKLSDNVFFILLVALFVMSLLPFLLAPSITLTLGLSLPPFILIYLQARARRRHVAAIIHNEGRFLESFNTNAEILWGELKHISTQRINEQEIISLVPEAIRKPSSYAKVLLEEIAKGKLYLLEAPRDSIIRPFRDEMEGEIGQVAYFASLSTKVGILGTFFGFIVALGTLSTFFATFGSAQNGSVPLGLNVPTSADLIQSTLQNLAYAFVKSVYGLALAILITTQTSGLRKALDHIYPMFNRALSFGQAFVNRMTLADPAIHSSLVEVRNALRNLHQRLFDHSGTVAKSLQEHGQLINEQTKIFSSAAEAIVDVQKNWDAAFTRLNEAGRVFEERTATGMNRIQQGFGAAASKIGDVLESLSVVRNELSIASGSLLETWQQSEEHWARRFEAFLSHVSAQDRKFEVFSSGVNEQDKKFSQWANIADNAFETVRQQMAIIEDNLKVNHSDFETNAQTNRDLVTATEHLEQALRNHTHIIEKSSKGWQRRALTPWMLALGALIVLVDLNFLNDPLKVKTLFEMVMQRM